MRKYELLWNYIRTVEEDTLLLSFDSIRAIAGVAIDHSFLTYKKELLDYGWHVKKISMKNQTVLFEREAS